MDRYRRTPPDTVKKPFSCGRRVGMRATKAHLCPNQQNAIAERGC
jgi:hypothetical protein